MSSKYHDLDRLFRSGEPIRRSILMAVDRDDDTPLIRSEGGNPYPYRGKTPDGRPYHERFVMSTEEVASDGGIIRAAGWKFDRFSRNSVLLWAHDYSSPPLGRVVHTEVRRRRLIGWVEFDTEDAFAADILRKIRAGFLSAVSVGFEISRWRTAWRDELTEAELKAGAVWVAEETELLELSIVPVPADSKALKWSAENEIEGRAQSAENESIHIETNEAGEEDSSTAEPIDSPDEGDHTAEGSEPEDPASGDVDPAGDTPEAGDEIDVERLARIEAIARMTALMRIRQSQIATSDTQENGKHREQGADC